MVDATAILAQVVGPQGAVWLAPHVVQEAVADGEAILREGVSSSCLFVLAAGELVVTVGSRNVVVATRGPGALLGEVGFVDEGPATATVTARGAATVLRLDHSVLEQLATDDPRAAAVLLRHVTRVMAQRIAAGSSGLLELQAGGQVGLRKPKPPAGWANRLFGWVVGQERP
jgi:CRP-like cAMP-binding protein